MIKLLNVFKYKKTKAPFVLFKNTIALLVLLRNISQQTIQFG